MGKRRERGRKPKNANINFRIKCQSVPYQDIPSELYIVQLNSGDPDFSVAVHNHQLIVRHRIHHKMFGSTLAGYATAVKRNTVQL